MNLNYYGFITLPKRADKNLVTELLTKMNACTTPFFEKVGTPAWSLDGNDINLLEALYSDDDIRSSLDMLSEFLKKQKLTAKGSIEYYGDYYGDYRFKRSNEYVEEDNNPKGWY